MEAMRIIKTITSDRLPELNNFKGRSVEIIILPDVVDENNEEKNESLLSLRGSMKSKIDGMEFQRQIRKEWER